jgi:hypothetical protein
MPAAAVAGGVALAGLAGQYFASQAQAKAARAGASAQVQAQAMAIGAQRDAEERARKYYEPFRQLGVRAVTPVTDSQYARTTGREIIGRDGWRIDSNGTPYMHAGTQQQNAMLRNTAAGNFSGGFGGGGFGGRSFGGGGGGGQGSGPVQYNPSFNMIQSQPRKNAMPNLTNAGGFFGMSPNARNQSSFGGGGSTTRRIGGGMTGNQRSLVRRK